MGIIVLYPLAALLGLSATSLAGLLAAKKASENPNSGQILVQTEKGDYKEKDEDKPKSNKKTSRTKTKKVDDPSSEQVEKRRSTERTLTPVWQHLVARFERFPRFGGIINRISEEIGYRIDRHEIVGFGGTDVQDGSSGHGRNIHAAHVIRAGKRNRRLRKIDPDLYELLGNILGHTQNVPRWVNEWNGLGGDIDRYQEKFRHLVIDIDFDEPLTSEIRRTLKYLKNEYLEILEKWQFKFCYDEEKAEEIEIAIEVIKNMSLKELFKKGKKGYDGDYNPFYM